MQTSTGDFTLTMDELRAVAGFALGCAAPVLPLFEKSNPTDARPAAALAAARLFVDGAPRSKLQRVAAADGFLKRLLPPFRLRRRAPGGG